TKAFSNKNFGSQRTKTYLQNIRNRMQVLAESLVNFLTSFQYSIQAREKIHSDNWGQSNIN
ncbi:MAG: hypothetical protein ACNYZG_12555, partial [Gammaproteobacteria bacterium]